ncbi:cache domain-containing sensor histidine kinase [Paenibacillus spongiae]|uniref:Sensor histidine kinase n=1 Tax=Paenibacillus spongiae TaxID=2909671 RepID=A0ABY5S102_9BACL|nr:sensor histidine kinase [Paenibacillus spongiae]UVI27534.1 sensor histidine kinase [Paenibacillus spongiae]
MRFRSKLILSFFIVISLTATIMGYSYYRITSEEWKTTTLQGLERLTEQAVNTLNLHLKTVANTGLGYFMDISLQKFLDGPPSFEDQQYYRNKLEGQLIQNPLISSITVARMDGEQYSSTYYYKPELRSLMKDELNRVGKLAHQKEGVPEWTVSLTTTRSSLTPVNTISYVQELKRITSSSQYPVGVLKIDINPTVLNNALAGLSDSDGSTYYMTDSNGIVIFAEDSAFIGQSIANKPIFQGYKQAAGRSGTINFRFQEDNKAYIGFYRKLNDAGWIVLGRAPLDRIMQKVNTFGKTVLFIALVSFLIAMLLASIISASVTRPLKLLNKKMKQVEMGDLRAVINVTGSDELATIQHSFNKMTYEIRTLITKVYETELLKKEAEIKALQTQINPHFLFNTLGTIDSIAAINGEPRIGYICQSLGNMLRYNLNGGSFATIREELMQLNQYLSIYRIRFADQFHYEMHVEDGIHELTIPKFLLQPLVENAIIRGLESKIGYKQVQVCIRHVDDRLIEFVIQDNGVGMDTAALQALTQRLADKTVLLPGRTSSRAMIGLSNVMSRIQMYYGFNAQIQIKSKPDLGTSISFRIPKQMIGGALNEGHDR